MSAERRYQLGDCIGINPEYWTLIDTGKKRSTIRRGIVDVVPGAIKMMHGGGRSTPIRVLSARQCRAADLTVDDALLDGFDSLDEVQQELRRYYPDIVADSVLTIIEFSPIL